MVLQIYLGFKRRCVKIGLENRTMGGCIKSACLDQLGGMIEVSGSHSIERPIAPLKLHWKSRSTSSLSTFYRLVHVLLLEHIFLFLKFNHLVHFLIA